MRCEQHSKEQPGGTQSLTASELLCNLISTISVHTHTTTSAHAWLAPLSFKHCTPLHLAAFYGHTSVVDVLLASGACEPNACNAQVRPVRLRHALTHVLPCWPSVVCVYSSVH